MREALSRWAHRNVVGFPLADLVLASAFCAVAVVSVLTGNPDEGPIVITLPAAVVMCSALAWRLRSGIVAVALITVAGIAQTVLARSPGSLWSLAVYAIIMYSVAAHYPEGTAAIVGGVMVGALLAEERIDNGVDYLFILLLFGGLWLLGRASRYWRGRVSNAELRQRDAARLAAAEERVRIARDLHDVVAHSLSVIAVQSDAAEAALSRNPDLAREPVEAIRSTARTALDEIRSLLGVLRSDDACLPGLASPGMGAIEGLIANARAAGVEVEYVASLTSRSVPPAVDLVAYRVVQESLTNVIKHVGPAATTVSLTQDAEALRIEVSNAASVRDALDGEHTSGYGLVGIRERVQSVGGTLSAGRTPDGGYRVDARIPCPADMNRVRP